MHVKEKKCKGINKASGYAGCGKLSKDRKYGLCPSCFKEWLQYTPEGIEHVKKATLKGKDKAAKEAKIKDRKVLSTMKDNILTKSKLEGMLQKKVNEAVRLIDKNCHCISSGRPLGQRYDAGHFYSVGSTPSLRFNFHNIFGQSVEQNNYKGGNPIGMKQGILSTFGKEYHDEVLALRVGMNGLKLSRDELKTKIAISKSIIKDVMAMREHVAKKSGLPSELIVFNPQQRIAAREYCNATLGLYKELEIELKYNN